MQYHHPPSQISAQPGDNFSPWIITSPQLVPQYFLPYEERHRKASRPFRYLTCSYATALMFTLSQNYVSLWLFPAPCCYETYSVTINSKHSALEWYLPPPFHLSPSSTPNSTILDTNEVLDCLIPSLYFMPFTQGKFHDHLVLSFLHIYLQLTCFLILSWGKIIPIKSNSPFTLGLFSFSWI